MIELINVNKTYKSHHSEPLKALVNVNLSFPETGLIFIHGRSGSGKTTLLSILGGLDNANSAKILLDNNVINRFNDEQCASYRNNHIGFVFQSFHLITYFNVFENIAFPLKIQGIKVDQKRVLNAIHEVGLDGLELRKISELSGGQKQRVAIARALIKNPTLLLADEPTGNLDTETSNEIFKLLKRFSQDRLVIVVSHDTEYAQMFADRIIELKNGEVFSDIMLHNTHSKQSSQPNRNSLKKAKLPFRMSIELGLGNLFHNKIRIVVSALIVSFLVAILSSIYTSLYAQSSATADIMRLSHQHQLLITDAFNSEYLAQYDPSIIIDSPKIQSIDRSKLYQIAQTYDSLFFARTMISVNDDFIRIKDYAKLNLVKQEWMIQFDEEMTQSILNTTLNFTSYTRAIYEDEIIIGNRPRQPNEIILSSQLLNLIQPAITDYEHYLQSQPHLDLAGFESLRIVGIIEENVPLMRDENIALLTNISLIYTHPDFLAFNKNQKVVQTYGVRFKDETDLQKLIDALKLQGNSKVLPATDERVNYYTRFQLTFLMGLLVPLIAYIAIIFLGYSISNSISYRRKSIGIFRALGVPIKSIQFMFWIEAIILGILIMLLVILMVPNMIDVLNFALKMQFVETHIFLTNYALFSFGYNHILEVFLILMTIFIVLVFTLTHHINLLDPNEVIRGR